MQHITVRCSPSDGILVRGVSRESRTAQRILKAHNLEWWTRGQAWYLPRMRKKPISDRVIAFTQSLAAELSKAGFSVHLQIQRNVSPGLDSCDIIKADLQQ